MYQIPGNKIQYKYSSVPDKTMQAIANDSIFNKFSQTMFRYSNNLEQHNKVQQLDYNSSNPYNTVVKSNIPNNEFMINNQYRKMTNDFTNTSFPSNNPVIPRPLKFDFETKQPNGRIFKQLMPTTVQFSQNYVPDLNLDNFRQTAGDIGTELSRRPNSKNAEANKAVANLNRNANEKIRIFTGSVEKVIKWNKIYRDYFCFYEVIGAITSIQEGTVRLQKIMLIRDKKGPILQVVHYVNDHICIENFFVGQMLRCVGRMLAPNMMHGLSIREANSEEVATLQRMCYVCDHAISKALMKF